MSEISRKFGWSLDRMNPLVGYTQSNVVLCCKVINYMKAYLMPKEFLILCSAIYNNLTKILKEMEIKIDILC